MELKPEYKLTEAGVIPEDWNSEKLGNFIALQRGHDLTWRERRNGEVPVIGSAGHNGFHNVAIARGPGVVLGRSGASFGQAHYCEQDFWPHNTALYVTDFRDNDPLFVFYFLTAFDFSRHNSGGAQQSLNRNFIAPLPIGVPPPPEQRSIATALSDMDALLVGLEQLIAKKRDLKQAAMQQLLTGKKRLPGFGEEKGYQETEIGAIPKDWGLCQVSKVTVGHKQGYYTKDKYVENGTRLVRITDLYNPRIDYEAMPMLHISDKDFEQYKISKGDFLFARSGAIGRYGIVGENIDAIFGSYIIRFNFNENKLLNSFFGYVFETQIMWKQLLSITQGSSNINIKAGNIKALTIPLPDTEEQRSIATLLCDMDTEIVALEQRRDKTHALKQGMMQELLTGRIRLV
ncbi:MAG: restriction endonuclease subunit S [Microcoleus sp.]